MMNAKLTFLITTAIFTILLSVFNKTKSTFPPETEILGEWVIKDSPQDKYIFYPNGTAKLYYGSTVRFSMTYVLTQTCESQTSTDDFFLKTTDIDDGTVECLPIVDLTASKMCLVTPNGRLVFYVRP